VEVPVGQTRVPANETQRVYSRRQIARYLAASAGITAVGVLLAACGSTESPSLTPTAGGATGTNTAATPVKLATTAGAGISSPVMLTTATSAPAGAAAPAPASSVFPSGGTITIGKTAIDPDNPDPAAANETNSNEMVQAVYEALVAYTVGTTEIAPRLATAWTISPDGLTYAFKLRQGVKFHDGSDFNADAVKFSFDRMLAVGKGAVFVLTGIYDRCDVVDPYTVNIVLKNPAGAFLGSLPKVFLVSPSYVKAHVTADDANAEKWMRANYNGTGPFKVASYEPGKQIIFEKNPGYWGLPERPRVDRVIIKAIPEQSSQRLQLEKGDIDAYMPPPDDVAALKKNPKVQVIVADSLQQLYVQISQIAPPFDNLKVRQAISLAFDYDQMISGVFNGLAVQAIGPLARNIPGFDSSLPAPKQDLAKAKQLLVEAGYKGGEIEYVFVQGDAPEKGAGLILQDALKPFGITLKVTELPWPQVVQRLQDKSKLMQLYGYYKFPPYPDPDAYLFSMYHTSNQIKGYNGNFYGTPETDKLMEQARIEVDPAKRTAMYKQLQERITNDVAAIFVANPKAVVAVSARTQNYLYQPTWHGTYNLDTIAVKAL